MPAFTTGVFGPGGDLRLTKNQTGRAQVVRSKTGRGAVMFLWEATNTAYRRRIWAPIL